MNPLATVGVFAAGLLVVFGAAVGVGRAVGPVGTGAAEPTHTTDAPSPDGHSTEDVSNGGERTEGHSTVVRTAELTAVATPAGGSR